ncbi:cytochrome-c oxidase, cbb3-type subunit II [bacterium endosymbiont of Bathymodiolus sp. 5 South]|jgi:cytochrome c oxidase cbb3-type subunit 2|uniref:cytochrome-c oxidase, cbb3-type subunit II n=1 Tax=bacterium endosymbiont of Bathymodiolus sp. 5 South TaxID=1181670 RepID=UPI0010B6CF9B|nr:cytochrome-c oxidase, cbb3-type subunit II [bacterium endosymbiont of Bathymodiolus sp. 5 South]CAC9643009.1 Cytochrome c oxidase (cbb3-type) subunit CcoO (EC 1.9.3.1) [uncultured Gammaproteobacteria bacterium]CAC9661000.1 Cytochrome c oxidase (cbb3-type) subunit CcoO (EC 1.9.3.1) [uncultured Gammaproteobacteria bacterium]SHN90376.1 Cytochrome c oxidase (cbb3-type) subunit CcoO [bacterium endosymbiont of Bathymodiolus sp. 5 South]SSC07515.1 Cytochrome c oxidase subunit CcoO [bacterium endosy
MLKLHRTIESNSALLIFGILIVASIGGFVQIVPNLFDESLHKGTENVKPYTALQLTGRDIYIREGCVGCHSQQVRPLVAEVMRYGPASKAGEHIYDRPFLWGSKRTGPDIARLGGKYSDKWHELHLINPRAVVPQSIMPAYPWLAKNKVDSKDIVAKLELLKWYGHPYTDEEIKQAEQAINGKTELEAVISYLQVLGTFR